MSRVNPIGSASRAAPLLGMLVPRARALVPRARARGRALVPRAKARGRALVPWVLVLMLMLLGSACATEAIDLLPDDAAIADLGSRDTEVRADAQADAQADASAPPDASPPETGALDTGIACVCRFGCSIDAECVRAVGAGSVCAGGVCTGSASACISDGDCARGFTCMSGETACR
ncbi:MAG: hypothetical protein IT384_10665 [Deltaproteobacteria bacterium]|nr:hypothetical protein [Deltaproteobacteria bacterium]